PNFLCLGFCRSFVFPTRAERLAAICTRFNPPPSAYLMIQGSISALGLAARSLTVRANRRHCVRYWQCREPIQGVSFIFGFHGRYHPRYFNAAIRGLGWAATVTQG